MATHRVLCGPGGAGALRPGLCFPNRPVGVRSVADAVLGGLLCSCGCPRAGSAPARSLCFWRSGFRHRSTCVLGPAVMPPQWLLPAAVPSGWLSPPGSHTLSVSCCGHRLRCPWCMRLAVCRGWFSCSLMAIPSLWSRWCVWFKLTASRVHFTSHVSSPLFLSLAFPLTEIPSPQFWFWKVFVPS